EAVLFYTSLLALEAQPSQDVPSPSGLVRSQVMSSADGAVRIPLNVSPAQSAEVTERGANPTGDTYPEHVAIACEDIFAAAATALGRGLEFLEVPENYYEDLEARFALDPQLLDALREHNISMTGTRPERSCTSTRPRSVRCSSRWSNGEPAIAATAPRTRRCGWPPSTGGTPGAEPLVAGAVGPLAAHLVAEAVRPLAAHPSAVPIRTVPVRRCPGHPQASP